MADVRRGRQVSAVRILDLFCGAGGCGMGYSRAGFEVVGVDISPQPSYPFEFHQADALEFAAGVDWGEFDAVHASPPCQAHSTLKARNRHVEDVDLVPETRAALVASGLPYVIENVPGAPLVNAIQLCGSSFGLDVRRHRLFETNWFVWDLPCDHSWQTPRFEMYEKGAWKLSPVVPVYGAGGWKAREHWDAAMGIDWMNTKELAQSIPPAYTSYIGHQLMDHILLEREKRVVA